MNVENKAEKLNKNSTNCRRGFTFGPLEGELGFWFCTWLLLQVLLAENNVLSGLRFVALSCRLIGKSGREVAISWASLALGSALSSEWVHFYFFVAGLRSSNYTTYYENVVYNVSFEPIAVPYYSRQVSVFTLFHLHCTTAPSLKHNLENLVHYTDSHLSRLSHLDFICLELECEVIITQHVRNAQQPASPVTYVWIIHLCSCTDHQTQHLLIL